MRLSVRFYKHCVCGSTSKNQKIWAEEALSDGIFRISRYSLKPLKNESSWRDQRPCTPSALSCASILCGKKSCSSMLSISVWYYCPPKYILCYSSVVSLKRWVDLECNNNKKDEYIFILFCMSRMWENVKDKCSGDKQLPKGPKGRTKTRFLWGGYSIVVLCSTYRASKQIDVKHASSRALELSFLAKY